MQKQHIGQIGDFWLSQRKGSDNWCRTWFDSRTRQTKRSSLGTDDFQQAQLNLAQWVVNNQVLKKEDPKDLPIETVLVRYYEHHAKKLPSANSSRVILGKWSDHFAEKTVSEIDLTAIEVFMNSLREQGYSEGYIGRILRAGKAAVNRSYKYGEISSVPYIPAGHMGDPRERRLTIEEVAALFNAVKSDHIFMYLMIAFNTLARPAAIMELTRFQIDFEKKLIALNPPGRKQTKKKRPTLPITETLFPWLKRSKSDYLVTWGGKPIKNIYNTFCSLRDRAGLDKDVIPYTIRHTMAIELRGRDVPAWELAGYMGHSFGSKTTERYAKYSPDFMSHARAAIDEYFVELQQHVERTLIFNKNVRVKSVLVSE